MIYIDFFNNTVLEFISQHIHTNDYKINYKNLPSLYVVYIKLSTAFFIFSLILFSTLFILNFVYFIFFKPNSFINKLFFYINILMSFVIEISLFLKVYLSFTIESIMKNFVLQEKLRFYKENKDNELIEHFGVFSSAFSDVIILLSIIVGLLCLDILGSKNYFKNINNNSIFYLFNLLVVIMASTNNLLLMFICFEFIFLPTVFFAYKFGYSKKIDKAASILFKWTLFGSFLVLCGLLYVYYKYNTLNYLNLTQKTLSLLEKRILFLLFLIGFSIKIPLAPFHYWLLKVHVESPTAYSIFLSGFLVKSAVYCLSMLLKNFYVGSESIAALMWFIYSMFVGTMGIPRQTDIKRLVAWCTVQEMSFILMFWGLKQTYLNKTYLIFIIIHGLFSAYMFFLVDIIQKRYKTRNMSAISGINILSPQLTKYIWFLMFSFSGFPLTAKFVVEWNFFALLSYHGFIFYLIVAFVINIFSILFLSKIIFTLLYGTPKDIVESMTIDIQKRELIILNTLVYSILMLTLLIYII